MKLWFYGGFEVESGWNQGFATDYLLAKRRKSPIPSTTLEWMKRAIYGTSFLEMDEIEVLRRLAGAGCLMWSRKGKGVTAPPAFLQWFATGWQ